MTFEEALEGLTGNPEIEPVYAYASDDQNGRLIRISKTPKGNASAAYGTGTSLFEGRESWSKIYKITRRVRNLDWCYIIPREWWRIEDLGYAQGKECQQCVHWQMRGSSYCWEHCQYTSPIMCCPSYAKRIDMKEPQ